MARRQTWKDARCLVTGARRALVVQWPNTWFASVPESFSTGRSSTKLEAIKCELVASGANPGAVHTLAADLTDTDERARFVSFTKERFGAPGPCDQ